MTVGQIPSVLAISLTNVGNSAVEYLSQFHQKLLPFCIPYAFDYFNCPIKL